MKTIEIRSELTIEFFSSLAKLACEAHSSLFVLRDKNGNVHIELARGTHGKLDAVIDYGEPVPFTDEVEMLAITAMRVLDGNSHSVRFTSGGVRAFLDVNWTARFSGGREHEAPSDFDESTCRPHYTRSLLIDPPRPKPERENHCYPWSMGFYSPKNNPKNWP